MTLSSYRIITFLILLLLQVSCSSGKQVEGARPLHDSKTFNKGYDEVWKALEEVLSEELMYPIRIKDKKKGLIETEWISIIRLRGSLRWDVRIFVDHKNEGTLVTLYYRVEEPSEIKEKLKNKKGEINTGWQTSHESIEDVGTILILLSEKLEGK
jgi:hypothetical protein